jgi:hypothetical protein
MEKVAWLAIDGDPTRSAGRHHLSKSTDWAEDLPTLRHAAGPMGTGSLATWLRTLVFNSHFSVLQKF